MYDALDSVSSNRSKRSQGKVVGNEHIDELIDQIRIHP